MQHSDLIDVIRAAAADVSAKTGVPLTVDGERVRAPRVSVPIAKLAALTAERDASQWAALLVEVFSELAEASGAEGERIDDIARMPDLVDRLRVRVRADDDIYVSANKNAARPIFEGIAAVLVVDTGVGLQTLPKELVERVAAAEDVSVDDLWLIAEDATVQALVDGNPTGPGVAGAVDGDDILAAGAILDPAWFIPDDVREAFVCVPRARTFAWASVTAPAEERNVLAAFAMHSYMTSEDAIAPHLYVWSRAKPGVIGRFDNPIPRELADAMRDERAS